MFGNCFPKPSQKAPQTSQSGSREPAQNRFTEKPPILWPKAPQMVSQGIPKGCLLGSIFESLFLQFSRRLPEPSQTPCTRVLEPFWLQFGSIFGAVWASFSETHGRVKIELPLQRELNSQGPGPSGKQQKNDFFQNPLWEGSWDPSWNHLFPIFGAILAPLGRPAALSKRL